MFAWFIVPIEVNKSTCTHISRYILVIFNHDKLIDSKNKIECIFMFKVTKSIFSYTFSPQIYKYIVYKLLNWRSYFLSNSFVKTFSCKLLTMRVLCRWDAPLNWPFIEILIFCLCSHKAKDSKERSWLRRKWWRIVERISVGAS